MSDEIINRVAQSQLMTIDLEDYYPDGKRIFLDISEWLQEGIILREKDFRAFVANHNWEGYKDTYVALGCSTEAIIPAWAFMLVASKLQPFANKLVQGTLEDLESFIYQPIIEDFDITKYTGKPVIIKGCSNKPVPQNAYLWITSKLLPVAKSVMYGEACSSVPIYKQR